MDLASLFASTTEALKEVEFPVVPVFQEPSGNGHVVEKKRFPAVPVFPGVKKGGL